MLSTVTIQKSRQRANQTFEQSDYAHREVVDRLLERLDYVLLKPECLLIYGWRVGYEIKCLRDRYPDAVIETCDDASKLQSFPENKFQMIVSSLALDWENEPKAVLQSFYRLLTDNGLLHFTTLGPDTAQELRNSFATVDDSPRVHGQTDMHHIGDCLKKTGYNDPVVDMEMLTLAYDDLSDLFRDLKNTASTNAHVDRSRGLQGKTSWQKMLSQYESLKTDDYFPFTLEIIYGHAWKVLRQEVGVSVANIPIKQKTSSDNG